YWFFAPLLGLGVIVALLRPDRAMRLPLLWLGLYPIAPALMNEIPSASRGIAGAPAFCVVAAIGAGALLRLAALVSERRTVVFALQGALPRRLPALLGEVLHRLSIRPPPGGRLLPRALRRVRPPAADDAPQQS